MLRMMKKALVTAMILSVLTASIAAVNAAGSYFLSEGFYYGVKNGEALVHGYEGDDWDIVIREKFLSYDVTAVEAHAFFENDTMQALSFYDATKLRSLGDFAFARCTKLQYVNITSSIQELGTGVFEGCTALSYARFRQGAAADIPKQCFYGCSELKTVIFENDPSTIGALAFAGCTALEQLTIPATVDTIAENAFLNCDDLTIYCYTDSAAHRFAEEHGMAYVLLDAPAKANIGGAEIRLEAEALRYDGTRQTPNVTVTLNGELLTAGIDYTVSYDNNLYAGEARVTVSGTGDYEGSMTASFMIYNVLGDADGDGRVTILDATAIRRVLASISVEDEDRVRLCGDIDGDGLNIIDATTLQRWLALFPTDRPINEMMIEY